VPVASATAAGDDGNAGAPSGVCVKEAIHVHRLFQKVAVPRTPGWSWSPAGELPEVQHHHVPVGRGTVVHIAMVEPEAPDAERAPILFMHSVNQCSFLFCTHIQEMGKDRRAMAMDIRGWGETVCPPEKPYATVGDCAADIEGVLNAFGISHVILFGLGMGAVVAWAAAQLIPHRILAMSNYGKGYGMLERWGGPQPDGEHMGPLARAKYYSERGSERSFGYLVNFADSTQWARMDEQPKKVLDSMYSEAESHDKRVDEYLSGGGNLKVFEPRPFLHQVWLKGTELNPFCSMLRLYKGIDISWQQLQDAPQPARMPLFCPSNQETATWEGYHEMLAEQFELTTVYYDVGSVSKAQSDVVEGDMLKRLREWANKIA